MYRLASLLVTSIFSLAFAATAVAAPITVNLAPNNAGYVTSFSYTSTEADITVTGWSNKSNGDKAIAQDQIARWWGSGLGVENQNSPQHAVDNSGRDYDALLFSFSEVVDVSGLGIGWTGGYDADVSLLAYTGAAPFSGGLTGYGSSWAALLDNGWSVVGNYDRNNPGAFSVNTDDFESQYWLVGAYNRDFGDKLSKNNDYFKLNSITFEAVEVPEPGMLLLMSLGLLGLIGARRRAA